MAQSSKWVILELNDTVDNPGYREIENAIVDTFGSEIDYFIPIHHEKIGSYISTSVLMEGYVFVKDCEAFRESLSNVRDSNMFRGALFSSGKISTVDSHVVSGLKRRLKGSLKKQFRIGTKVRICDGALKNLVGEVVNVEDGGLLVVVKINRLSREIIAPVPATLVEQIGEFDNG